MLDKNSAPSQPILGQSLEGMLAYPSTLSRCRARRRYPTLPYLREASLAASPTACRAASTARWLDKSLAVLSDLSGSSGGEMFITIYVVNGFDLSTRQTRTGLFEYAPKERFLTLEHTVNP